MTRKEALLTATVSSVMTLGALTMSSIASAQDAEMEKCYGIVKAGKNDCAGPGHTCQGQAKTDASPQEFVMVPAGTCERLVNGSTTAKAE
jgi:uncharacterized membrane protein